MQHGNDHSRDWSCARTAARTHKVGSRSVCSDTLGPRREKHGVNFEIMDGSILLGEYDYGSIMHYGEYFFSKNGLPTIEPLLNTNQQIGQRIETSPGDRESVARLYQTDLTLVANTAQEVSIGQEIELNLQVTNNTDTGANSLSINVPLSDGIGLESYRSSNWSCFERDTAAVCEAPVLAAGENTTVTLNLSGQLSLSDQVFDASLSSRTRDTYTSDNHDSASTRVVEVASIQLSQDAIPEIASALDGDADVKNGGATDVKLLAALFALICFQRRRDSAL